MFQPGRAIFTLEPQYRERVWGGRRLRPADPPVGEAWLAFGESRVASGPTTGSRLDELVAADGPALLGRTVVERFGPRFPLIVKLLDCADWLSVQVHPNDDQARTMVGPGEFGKTEAWYFIDAEAGARIKAGVKDGVDSSQLAVAIRTGRVLDVMVDVPIEAGTSLLIPSGTLHSLGPGLLLYEVQQASDTTYRAYDWERPQIDGRRLHLEESAAVALPVGPGERHRPLLGTGAGAAAAETCRYFDLELARAVANEPLAGDTGGLSFHALTVIDGAAEVVCDRETLQIGRFETALVAASAGRYGVRALGGPVTLLRSSVPGPA
jgi:mannose-6-phosphate isomerase